MKKGNSGVKCLIIAFSCITAVLRADTVVCQDLVNITRDAGIYSEITCIGVVDGTDIVYAGTRQGLYSRYGDDRGWQKEDLGQENLNITSLAFSGGKMFASSDNGLFEKIPGQERWRRVTDLGGLRGVVPGPEKGSVIIWTRKDIFTARGRLIEKLFAGDPGGVIEAVSSVDGVTYVARSGNLFYTENVTADWRRYFIRSGRPFEDEEQVLSDDGDHQPGAAIRDLFPVYTGGVMVSTETGVLFFDGSKERSERIDTIGISSPGIEKAAVCSSGLFVLTGNKVMHRSMPWGLWRTVFSSPGEGAVVDLKVHKDLNGKSRLFIAAQRNIYVRTADTYPKNDPLNGDPLEKRVLHSTRPVPGPGIEEVHKMAIGYADVSPDKIRRWKAAASWKAVLPRLTVAFSEDQRDNIEFYKSANTSYLLSGPRKRNNDWRVNMVWDLSDLIWSGAQTSIDVRSRLMVQLRINILEDVTRLYFERKRLIKEIKGAASEDSGVQNDKILRIKELTAYIDAYTGGEFSRTLDI